MNYERLEVLMSERSHLLHLSTCYSRGDDYCDLQRTAAEAKHEEIVGLWIQCLEDRRPVVAQEIQVNGERYLLQSHNGKEAKYVKLTEYRPGPHKINPLSFEAHVRQQIQREQPDK